LKIIGAKNNSRVNLKIYDPEGTGHRENRSEMRDSRDDIDTSALEDLKI